MTTISKKQPTKAAKGKTAAPKTKDAGRTQATNSGTKKRPVRRDEQGRFKECDARGRLVEKANEHMERAWGKIYEGRAKNRQAA